MKKLLVVPLLLTIHVRYQLLGLNLLCLLAQMLRPGVNEMIFADTPPIASAKLFPR